jgi:RNA polymerase sigma-70 factor (ECF subfamily)
MAAVEGTAWEHDVKARLVARDAAALSEMYEQFGSYIYGLAARVIGDRRAAEDVTQDVFLSIEHLGPLPRRTAKSRMRLGLRRIADALAAKGMEHTWT